METYRPGEEGRMSKEEAYVNQEYATKAEGIGFSQRPSEQYEKEASDFLRILSELGVDRPERFDFDLNAIDLGGLAAIEDPEERIRTAVSQLLYRPADGASAEQGGRVLGLITDLARNNPPFTKLIAALALLGAGWTARDVTITGPGQTEARQEAGRTSADRLEQITTERIEELSRNPQDVRLVQEYYKNHGTDGLEAVTQARFYELQKRNEDEDFIEAMKAGKSPEEARRISLQHSLDVMGEVADK